MFRRVLLVDDDPVLLDDLKTLFENEFETVVTASDGAEAYIRLQEGPFDLIFSDIKMPGMTGVELTRIARSEGVTTPIILSSSGADQDHLIHAIRLGIHDFIEKPFTPDQLKDFLYRVLEVIRREKKLQTVIHEKGNESQEALQQRKMLGLLQAVGTSRRKAL